MKKIKYLTIGMFVLIFQYNTVVAQQQVSITEAINVAIQASNTQQGMLRSAIAVNEINVLQNENSDTLIYEINFADGQSVLLSGSKACLPVLGYVNLLVGKSVFDNDMPDGLKSMLQEYKEQIELCFENDTISLYHLNDWQELQSNALLRNAVSEPVSPLLTSHWHQKLPYNYYAPTKNCGKNCPAGCVAIAMAQIMYYWKQPVLGYDWCNIGDNVNSYYPERQQIAVARLVKACADAVDMDYDCNGSSAQTGDARDAFVETFGYSEDADWQQKMWHSNTTWKNRIKNDLNLGRPVLYRGKTVDNFIGLFPAVGHAFVCDGYRNDGTFHFNFGWGGSGDAWLKLDNLVPNDSEYNFSSYQAALFYLHPENETLSYCDFDLSMTDLLYPFCGLASVIPSSVFKSLQANLKPTRLTSVDATTAHGAAIPTAWHNVFSGETVEYVAQTEIVLKPGFHAQVGSNFTARIEPCTNCGNGTANRSFEANSEDFAALDLRKTKMERNEDIAESGNSNAAVEKVTVYPNPASTAITIDFTGYEGEKTISIFDISGKLAKTAVITNSRQEINIAELPKGVYLVNVYNSGKEIVHREKLIKN